MAKRRRDVPSLGPLEHRVMGVLWDHPSAHLPVRTVAEHIGEALAYTTVMTVLGRLHEKRLARRRREGRGFSYAATMSRTDYAARKMSAALGTVPDTLDVLHQFVGQLSAGEQRALREILEDRSR